jgi:uncharacterized protein YuzE
MKFNYDRDADAIYFYLSSGKYSYGDDKDEDRRIDYSSDNKPIGVELLSVSEGVNVNGLPNVDEIESTLKSQGISTYYKMSHDTCPNFDGIAITFRIHLGGKKQKQPHGIVKEAVTA